MNFILANLKKIIIAVVILIAVIIAIVVFTSNSSDYTYDPFLDVELRYDGHNENGTATVRTKSTLDLNAEANGITDDNILTKDGMKKYLTLELIDHSGTYTVDKSENLSNGDVVTVTFEIDKKILNDNKVNLVNQTKEFTVSELETVFMNKEQLDDDFYDTIKEESTQKTIDYIKSNTSSSKNYGDLVYLGQGLYGSEDEVKRIVTYFYTTLTNIGYSSSADYAYFYVITEVYIDDDEITHESYLERTLESYFLDIEDNDTPYGADIILEKVENKLFTKKEDLTTEEIDMLRAEGLNVLQEELLSDTSSSITFTEPTLKNIKVLKNKVGNFDTYSLVFIYQFERTKSVYTTTVHQGYRFYTINYMMFDETSALTDYFATTSTKYYNDVPTDDVLFGEYLLTGSSFVDDIQFEE